MPALQVASPLPRPASLPHRFRLNALRGAPMAVGRWRDLAGLNLAAAAPEDVGVSEIDARFAEVLVDGGLVSENELFVDAVGHAHDVDVAKFRAAFPPVGVSHDVMPPAFTPRVQLPAGGHRPVEQRVEARDALAVRLRLDVFEKSGEAADDFAPIEV